MSETEHIKSLAKEAEVYRIQGLSEESKEKYLELLQFIQRSPKFRSHKRLIEDVQNKIRTLEKDMAELDEEPATPILSKKVQDVIKESFSYAKNGEAVSVEGAVALVKFGQYDRALDELRSLLKQGISPVVAAKNIIRCHLAVSSPDAAIEEFKNWTSREVLSAEQLKSVRMFLENVLEKRGITAKLPEVAGATALAPQAEARQEEVIDICSVRLRMKSGPQKGKTAEFDIALQSGNIVSFIISPQQKALTDLLPVGVKLPDIEFYSPIALFRGSAVVTGNTEIRSGPNKGAYMLDLKIDGL